MDYLARDDQEADPFLARDNEEETAVVIQAIPDTAMSLEASTLALLGAEDDMGAMEQYAQTMGVTRDEQPSYMQGKRDRLRQQFDESYRAALLPVLADSTVPMSMKEAAIANQKSGDNTPIDPVNILYNESLASESKGESITAEQVRMKLADNLRAGQQSISDSQVIVNAAIGKRSGTVQKIGELLEMFVPGVDQSFTAQIGYKREGANVAAAAAVLPGSAKKNLSDAIRAMPPEKRGEFLKELAKVAKESSGVFTDVNQLQLEAFLTEVGTGQYGSVDKFIDNTASVLDFAGLGGLLRGVGKAGKAGKAAWGAKQAAIDAENARIYNRVDPLMDNPIKETGPIAGVTGDAKITSSPQSKKTASQVDELDREYAQLLEDATGKLDKGQVKALQDERAQIVATSKTGLTQKELSQKGAATRAVERKADINAQVKRIDEQLASNANASKAEQRLSEIEKEKAALLKDMTATPTPLNPLTEAINRAYNQSTFVTHHPRSPGSVLYLTNPAKARTLHAQAFLDETGAIAQATHGVSREEALLKGVSPQVTDATGRVKKVPDDMENLLRTIMADQLGLAVKNTFGGFGFTEKELASARAAKVEDYSSATGITLNPAMTSFEHSGAKTTVNAVYTTGEGGWLKAEDAVAQAEFALRKQGVKSDEIQVMRLDGDEYVPVKLEEVKGVEGDYVVRISRDEHLDANSVKDWDELDVKRNWLDRFQTSGNNSQGSFARFIADPASMMHKQLVGAMSVADDHAARLTAAFLEVFETKFTKPFMSLSKERRAALEDYIKEANVKEIKFDPIALATQFSSKEVDVLRGWRDSWDIAWAFENLDLVRTLRKDKFEWLDTPNLQAAVRPRPKRFENNHVYDASTDSNRVLTKIEIDEIYKNGGYIGEFRRPLTLQGETMEYVIVRNTPTEYSRGLNDTDKLLEYRDGYYQVSYKAPKFIDETVVDSRGKSRTVTIGVTGTIDEAEQLVKNLSAQHPDRKYVHRGDDRKIERNADMYWDMNHVGGRIAQRHRGQLLENGVGIKQMGSQAFIESPSDAALKAAMSIGGRMAMRQTLEVAKERYVHQFSHLLKHEDGFARFPTSRDEIAKKGEEASSELADARTTWEYINYMENGYINAMDNKLKAAMNIFADAAGMKGFGTVEKLARAGSDVNITGTTKGAVFASMIASNPLRQYIVQINQGLRTLAYNPLGWISGNVNRYVAGYALGDTPLKFAADTEDFIKFYHGTGMSQAITRGNLIRGTLLEASGRQGVAGKVSDATVGNLRKYGYDKAENANNVIHAASVYDKYRRAGANLADARVKEMMHQETRALAGNMNFAGDMPYNQNWMALAFTYMQVPHKFLLQATNRQLTRFERTRLVAADLAFWGVPTGLVSYFVGKDLLPEDEDVRDIVVDGLESWIINRSLSAISGEKQSLDTSSLAPYDMDGWGKIMQAFFFDGGIKGVIDNSPTARVFGLSADSRTGLALKTSRDYFMSFTDKAHEYTNPELKDVMDNWGKMSTGWSNYQKARAMWHYGQARDKQGRIIDDQTTKVEAVGQLFGFGPKDASKYYQVMLDNTVKSAKDSAKADIKQLKIMINSYTNGDATGERAVRMFTQQMADMASKPSTQYHAEYMANVQAEMAAPAWQKEMAKLVEIVGFPSLDITRDPFYQSTLDEDKKKRMVDVHTRSVNNWVALEKQAKELEGK